MCFMALIFVDRPQSQFPTFLDSVVLQLKLMLLISNFNYDLKDASLDQQLAWVVFIIIVVVITKNSLGKL